MGNHPVELLACQELEEVLKEAKMEKISPAIALRKSLSQVDPSVSVPECSNTGKVSLDIISGTFSNYPNVLEDYAKEDGIYLDLSYPNHCILRDTEEQGGLAHFVPLTSRVRSIIRLTYDSSLLILRDFLLLLLL